MDSVDAENVEDVDGGESEGIAEDSIDGSNAAEQTENNPSNVDNVEESANENANDQPTNENRAQEGNLRDEYGKERAFPERVSFIGG